MQKQLFRTGLDTWVYHMNQFVNKADEYLRLKYVPAHFANVHLDDDITACPTDQTFHRVEATALVRAHA